MLNRNALKCIKLPSSYIKCVNGETSNNWNQFEIDKNYYKPYRVSSAGNYYMGLFNSDKDLDINTYSIDGEIIIEKESSSSSYVSDRTENAVNLVTLTRTITNNTNANYDVNTIGIIYCENPNIPRYALMSCERIPTVTIKPGETYTFTHKIKIG